MHQTVVEIDHADNHTQLLPSVAGTVNLKVSSYVTRCGSSSRLSALGPEGSVRDGESEARVCVEHVCAYLCVERMRGVTGFTSRKNQLARRAEIRHHRVSIRSEDTHSLSFSPDLLRL